MNDYLSDDWDYLSDGPLAMCTDAFYVKVYYSTYVNYNGIYLQDDTDANTYSSMVDTSKSISSDGSQWILTNDVSTLTIANDWPYESYPPSLAQWTSDLGHAVIVEISCASSVQVYSCDNCAIIVDNNEAASEVFEVSCADLAFTCSGFPQISPTMQVFCPATCNVTDWSYLLQNHDYALQIAALRSPGLPSSCLGEGYCSFAGTYLFDTLCPLSSADCQALDLPCEL